MKLYGTTRATGPTFCHYIRFSGRYGQESPSGSLGAIPITDSSYVSLSVHQKNEGSGASIGRGKELKAFVIHTLVVENLSEFTDDFCEAENLPCYNILKDLVKDISKATGQLPLKRAGALHRLDDEYFNRISAIEFAVKYDDGKDPKGFLDADLVLLGVSRTSKTPLSMFGKQKHQSSKLADYAGSLSAKEIWQVDPKIVGLTNDAEVLNNFRKRTDDRLRIVA